MVTQTFLVIFILTFGIGNITTSVVFTQNPEISVLFDILSGLFSGPLRGRTVGIFLQEATEGIYSNQDELIKSIKEPTLLLRTSLKMPRGLLGQDGNQEDSPRHHSDNAVTQAFSLRQSVAVIILEDNSSFSCLSSSQFEKWELSTVVIVDYSPFCSDTSYLKTPLVQKIPSGALLCRQAMAESKSRIPIDVWSWITIAGETKLSYRGTWNPASFQSWDQLFIDNFKTQGIRHTPFVFHSGYRPRSHSISENRRFYQSLKFMEAFSRLLVKNDFKGYNENSVKRIAGIQSYNSNPIPQTSTLTKRSLDVRQPSLIANARGADGCLPFVIAQWDPFVMIKKATPPYVVYGCSVDIVDIIAKHLGICYELVRALDNDWGTVFPNGTWTGSLGLLNRGEVAMSVVPYSVSLLRSTAVDFSEQIYMDELTVAYRRNELLSDMAGFIKPFTFETWICIFGSLLTISLVMIIIRVPLLGLREKKSVEGKVRFSYSVWPLTCLLEQSSYWSPQHDSTRLAGGIWVLMAFIISCLYRSTLMAMLITPQVDLPFNSYEDLAKTDIDVWAPTGSRFHQAVDAAPEESKMGGIKKNLVFTSDSAHGVASYRSGKWALGTVRRTHVYYLQDDFTKHGYCRLYIMADGVFKTTPISLAFPKGSPLKAPADRIIMNLKEFGITDHLFNQHVANATSCLKPIGSGFTDVARPLALYDFYGVLMIYMMGMILGSATFLFEILPR